MLRTLRFAGTAHFQLGCVDVITSTTAHVFDPCFQLLTDAKCVVERCWGSLAHLQCEVRVIQSVDEVVAGEGFASLSG